MSLFDIDLKSTEDDIYPVVKGDFIITCTVIDIEDGYEVMEYTVDEPYYDEEVKSLVLFELEYDKYPDLGMSAGDTGEFKLKVSSQYTKDYYGECDVDIQVEVLPPTVIFSDTVDGDNISYTSDGKSYVSLVGGSPYGKTKWVALEGTVCPAGEEGDEGFYELRINE